MVSTTKVPVTAEEIPPVFGKEDTWYVQDKNGNVYKMMKNPYDIFIQMTAEGPELHLVYSPNQSKLKGQRTFAPFENNKPKKFDPF